MFTELCKQHFPISATYFYVKDLYPCGTYNHASADMVTFIKIDYSSLGWYLLFPCIHRIIRLEMFCKNSAFKNFAKSQENTCARALFDKLTVFAYKYIKIATPAQVFSCEFCDVFKTLILKDNCEGLFLISIYSLHTRE